MSPTIPRVWIWSAGFIGLYWGIGSLLLPKLLHDKLVQDGLLGSSYAIKVETVKFNPFIGKLALNTFSLQEKDKEPSAQFRQLMVNFDVLGSLLNREIRVDELALDQPIIRLEHYRDGKTNLTPLLEHPSSHSDSSSKPPVIPGFGLEKLSISGGQLSWTDHLSNGQPKETVFPLELSVENLTTTPNIQGHFAVSFEMASGGKANWQGQLSLTPLQSEGTLQL